MNVSYTQFVQYLMRWCLQNRDTSIEIHPLSHLQVPIFQLVPLTLRCLLLLSIFPQHIPVPLESLTPQIPVGSPHILPLFQSQCASLEDGLEAWPHQWRGRTPGRLCHFLVHTTLHGPLSFLISRNHCPTQADATGTGLLQTEFQQGEVPVTNSLPV